MKIYATRSSVHPGDDIEAPHPQDFENPESAALDAAIADIAKKYLPSIFGGKATWSVCSNVVLGVLAQQWSAPKMYLYFKDQIDIRDGVVCLHFNYHMQLEPQAVYDIFWGMRLRAQ